MSPEEFKSTNLASQIGRMAERHALDVADLHLRYSLVIQELQEKIAILEADPALANEEAEGEGIDEGASPEGHSEPDHH